MHTTYFQGLIDASEEGYDDVMDLGQSMVDSGHKNKDEIEEKMNALKDERQQMLHLWEKKKVNYDQCMELQLFNRDIEQMEVIMVKQEVC